MQKHATKVAKRLRRFFHMQDVMAIRLISPGKDSDKIKNEDRADIYSEDTICTAIVCDGTSSSPNSAQAAEIVTRRATEIFEPNGIETIIATLKEERKKLFDADINLGEAQASLHDMLKEIVQEKRKSSFQTTFMAVQLKLRSNPPGISWIGCGDSAFFVFDKDTGELFENSLGGKNKLKSFEHTSHFTAVIPDSYKPEQHTIKKVSLPRSVRSENIGILLCSDGFYDSFENFAEIHYWLKNVFSAFAPDPVSKEIALALMKERHAILKEKRGDDDISFVVCCPSNKHHIVPYLWGAYPQKPIQQ